MFADEWYVVTWEQILCRLSLVDLKLGKVLQRLKSSRWSTFFVVSAADLSQQASIFALRATGEMDSSFRHNDRVDPAAAPAHEHQLYLAVGLLQA